MAQGRAQSRAQDRAQGKAQGRAQDRAQGRAQGKGRAEHGWTKRRAKHRAQGRTQETPQGRAGRGSMAGHRAWQAEQGTGEVTGQAASQGAGQGTGQSARQGAGQAENYGKMGARSIGFLDFSVSGGGWGSLWEACGCQKAPKDGFGGSRGAPRQRQEPPKPPPGRQKGGQGDPREVIKAPQALQGLVFRAFWRQK